MRVRAPLPMRLRQAHRTSHPMARVHPSPLDLPALPPRLLGPVRALRLSYAGRAHPLARLRL